VPIGGGSRGGGFGNLIGFTRRLLNPGPDKSKYHADFNTEEFKIHYGIDIRQKYSKIIVIEMNDGQYRHELEAFLKRDIYSVTQLGGKISLKEIENELSKIYSE